MVHTPISTDSDEHTVVDLRTLPALTVPPVRPAVDERYSGRGVLGEGGMGEVRLYRDEVIGREVAMKVLLPERQDDPVGRARFLREALVQGQLEHPSIVPVYDVGTTASGHPYFTMKRIVGESLRAVLRKQALEDDDPNGSARRHSTRRLLEALASACLAVDFAHSKGVVHRDLKPGNLMLGEYGEVYVLDWGVARLLDSHEGEFGELVPEIGTRVGTVLGTPGYLAPEQALGQDADARADVHALGCIVFEVAAGMPLVPEGSDRERLAHVRRGADVVERARTLNVEIAPELIAIVAQATHPDRDRRMRSARALHDALRDYLDHAERDIELQKRANRHARTAERARQRLLEAKSPVDPDREAQLRRTALQEAGLAIALVPGHERALAVIGELLADPPDDLPGSAAVQALQAQASAARRGLRQGALARFSWLVYAPIVFWLGIRNVGLTVLLFSLALAAGIYELWASNHRRPSMLLMRSAAVLALVSLVPLAFVLGPYGLLPLVVLTSLPSLLLNLDRRSRHWAVATALLVVGVPGALEWAGIFPAYEVKDEVVRIFPSLVHFDETPLRVCMLLVSFGCILTSARLVGGVRETLRRTEDRLHAQAWQLRQIVPRKRDSGDTTTHA